jgi:hypothetical protein
MSFFDYLCSDVLYLIGDLLESEELKKVLHYFPNDGNSYFWGKKPINLGMNLLYDILAGKCGDISFENGRITFGKSTTMREIYEFAYYDYFIFQGIYIFNNSWKLKKLLEDDYFLERHLNTRDKGGYTLLMFLCRDIHPEYIFQTILTDVECFLYLKKLIHLGADVNIQASNGMTALMYACQDRNINFVNELIKAGADVNLKNIHGVPALSFVGKSKHNQFEKYRSLIRVGASYLYRYCEIKDHEPEEIFKSSAQIAIERRTVYCPFVQTRKRYAAQLINKEPEEKEISSKKLPYKRDHKSKTQKKREKLNRPNDKYYQQQMKTQLKMKKF